MAQAVGSDRHLLLLSNDIMRRADGLYAHRGQRCYGNPIFTGPPCWV